MLSRLFKNKRLWLPRSSQLQETFHPVSTASTISDEVHKPSWVQRCVQGQRDHAVAVMQMVMVMMVVAMVMLGTVAALVMVVAIIMTVLIVAVTTVSVIRVMIVFVMAVFGVLIPVLCHQLSKILRGRLRAVK